MLIKLRDVPQKKLLGSKIIATIRKKTAGGDTTVSGYCEKVVFGKNNKRNVVIKTADGEKISIGEGALISLVQ